MQNESSILEIINNLQSESFVTRLTAAGDLIERQDVRAIPFLLDILHNDKENAVRRTAAIALGRSQNKEAFISLLDALNSNDGRLQHCAAIALGELGDRRAVETLVSIALHSKR